MLCSGCYHKVGYPGFMVCAYRYESIRAQEGAVVNLAGDTSKTTMLLLPRGGAGGACPSLAWLCYPQLSSIFMVAHIKCLWIQGACYLLCNSLSQPGIGSQSSLKVKLNKASLLHQGRWSYTPTEPMLRGRGRLIPQQTLVDPRP